MQKLNLTVKLIDKHKIFTLKAKYDPSRRLAECKRGFREKNPMRFLVDPDHIYEEYKGRKRFLVCYVDNANRKSVELERVKTIVEDGVKKEAIVKENVEAEAVKIHSDDPVDTEKAIKLDMLIDIAFWKSIAEKRKIALSTVLTFLIAGIGIYTLIVTFLRACGINV